MSTFSIVVTCIIYLYVLLIMKAVTFADTGPLVWLKGKAPTKDAEKAIEFFGLLLWPLFLVGALVIGTIRFCKYLYRSLRGWKAFVLTLGRGIRDLMPRRAAKIPVAKVVNKS